MASRTRLVFEGDNRTDRAFGSIRRNLVGLGQGLARATRGASGLITLLAGAGLVRGLQRIVEAGDEVDKLSGAFGASAETVSEWIFIIQRAGGRVRDFGVGIRTLQQRTQQAQDGLSTAVRQFDALGISAEKFSRLSVERQLEAIADGLQGVENQSQRTDILANLFGGRGAQAFANAFADGSGGIAELREEARRFNATLSAGDASAAADAADAVTNFSAAITGLGRAFATSGVIPSLTDFANGLSSIVSDLSTFRTSGGEAVKQIELLSEGQRNATTAVTAYSRWVDKAVTATLDWVNSLGRVDQSALAGQGTVERTTEVIEELGTVAESTAASVQQVSTALAEVAGRSVPEIEPTLEIVEKTEPELNALGQAIDSTLTGAVRSAGEGMRDIFANVLNQLAQDLLSSALLRLLSNIGIGVATGEAGGAAAVAGSRAFGGPVSGGQIYRTHGLGNREFFVPNQDGQIVTGGAGGAAMVFNIDARGAGPGERLRIEEGVKSAVALAEAQRVDRRRRRRG